jgi:phage-related protein
MLEKRAYKGKRKRRSTLEEDIWELRPGRNRVLFFYHKDDTYVLLHHFLKKTQKTPRREIEKAKSERNDWITRKG